MPDERDLEMDLYSGRVRSVIRQYYMRRAAGCFDHASRNHRDVRGTVLIGFEIQDDGTVRDARVDRNTTGIDSLGGCLARQVGSWRLPPPPEGNAPLAMQMPFSR
ncbi:MAG TPA: AgmX/PglI C-terminal domain-containing protein [Sandaracinaceae bacterium LLY-WYZ-13_1]|nr:AgmX/PglI C-terminal domain-containing protein [Sandaracinaceae bacterium LLY-WYZ-13_1]